MSVIINGVDMPKACDECPLNHDGECGVAPHYDFKDCDSWIVAKNGRRDDCPLREFIQPPHVDYEVPVLLGVYDG